MSCHLSITSKMWSFQHKRTVDVKKTFTLFNFQLRSVPFSYYILRIKILITAQEMLRQLCEVTTVKVW